MRVIGVYDADGGLVGELRYVVGKVLGRAHCARCDVTHGSIRERPGVPFDLLHRDEAGPDLRAAGLPVVVDAFERALRDALASAGIRLDP